MTTPQKLALEAADFERLKANLERIEELTTGEPWANAHAALTILQSLPTAPQDGDASGFKDSGAPEWHKDIPEAIAHVEKQSIESLERAITACQDWDVAGMIHEGLVTDMATAYLANRKSPAPPVPDGDALKALEAMDRWEVNDSYMPDWNEHKDTIRAALTSAPVQSVTWMPIESAPRDGTAILLAVPGEDLQYKPGSVARTIGYYARRFTLPAHDDVHDPEKYPNHFECQESSGEWFSKEGFFTSTWENNYGDEIAVKINPTHWQPLPKPPEKE